MVSCNMRCPIVITNRSGNCFRSETSNKQASFSYHHYYPFFISRRDTPEPGSQLISSALEISRYLTPRAER